MKKFNVAAINQLYDQLRNDAELFMERELDRNEVVQLLEDILLFAKQENNKV